MKPKGRKRHTKTPHAHAPATRARPLAPRTPGRVFRFDRRGFGGTWTDCPPGGWPPGKSFTSEAIGHVNAEGRAGVDNATPGRRPPGPPAVSRGGGPPPHTVLWAREDGGPSLHPGQPRPQP